MVFPLPLKITSNSESETVKIAKNLAEILEPNEIILLSGTLGAGKSVFARALIRHLSQNPDMDVPSPTFTLVQTYETPETLLYHFDLYRLEEPEEIYELGWEDAVYEGMAIVEWPERLGPLKPSAYLDIQITSGNNESNRIISIQRVNK